MKVLVTGANGFIGSALVDHLLTDTNYSPVAAIRSFSTRNSIDAPVVEVGNISNKTNWIGALKDIDIVIHTAAHVHVMKDVAQDPLQEFRKINVEGTLCLARQAAAVGVRRFIYISSVKVNGEINKLGNPFTVEDAPEPQDAYGVSKMESEQGLKKISLETGMEVVVIRPPLVYGPSVEANFLRLMNAVYKRVPLPLASIENCRSLVGRGNLVAAIIACLSHPVAVGKIYLVSDGDDVSTPELIRRIAQALGCSPNLFFFPPAFIKWGGQLIGKKQEVDRLLGTLVVDSSAIQHDLSWTPPNSMFEELNSMAKWYRATFS